MTTKTRAALITAPGRPFRTEELDLDAPREREVQVRLAAAGVCHSDYHLVTGDTQHPMPCVAGHEGAGIVEGIGPGVTTVGVGDRVVLSWAPSCGRCFYCQRNRPALCVAFTEPLWSGVLLDGTPRFRWRGAPVYHYCGLAAFSESTVVPAESCVPLRRDVPLEVAALVGCAVATGVGAVLRTASVRPGDRVAVYGVGGVGLSAVMGASLRKAGVVIAVDRVARQVELARELGATHGIVADGDVTERVRERTEGLGADIVIECTGLPAVQEAALAAVRPGGTLVLTGLAPMGSVTNLPAAIITREEKTVRGSYYGSVHPQRDFPVLIDLYLAGKLPIDRLITHRYRLSELNEAYEAMLAGGVGRGVLVFPS